MAQAGPTVALHREQSGACVSSSVTALSESGGVSGLLPVCLQQPGWPEDTLETHGVSNVFLGICTVTRATPYKGQGAGPLLVGPWPTH